LKYIPNALTFLRLLLVPLFAICFFLASPAVALVLFLLAGATDILDGYLARRFSWGSTLGKVLDPVADKSMQCTVLVVLVIAGYIPLLLIIPFILKEVVQLFCGLLFFRFRHDVTVSCWYGKLAICVFYLTVSLTILFREAWQGLPLLPILWIVTLILMLCALVGYVVRYSRIARNMKNNKKNNK